MVDALCLYKLENVIKFKLLDPLRMSAYLTYIIELHLYTHTDTGKAVCLRLNPNAVEPNGVDLPRLNRG